MNGSNRRGGSNFFCPPSSGQAQSIGTLIEQIGLKGGSVDMSKKQRHTRIDRKSVV